MDIRQKLIEQIAKDYNMSYDDAERYHDINEAYVQAILEAKSDYHREMRYLAEDTGVNFGAKENDDPTDYRHGLAQQIASSENIDFNTVLTVLTKIDVRPTN